MVSCAVSFPFIICLQFVIFQILVAADSRNYTSQEKTLIKQLRERVKTQLTQPIMYEDHYLIRFLRAQKLDLNDAENMINTNLAWRKRERMDTIFEEDWSTWMKNVPISFNMHDREGRTVLTCGIGQIDPRRLILAGKQLEMDRYFAYGYERGVYNVHQSVKKTGHIDGYMLFNMAGYTARTHGCLACIPSSLGIPSWVKILVNYERYYPELCTEIISINTPRIFQSVFNIMKPSLSSRTAKILKLYDYDKAHWKRELLKRFSEDVLSIEFGGTAPFMPARSLHNQDIQKIIYYNNNTLISNGKHKIQN